MKRHSKYRPILGLVLLALAPVLSFAHQISLIRGEALVHRDKIDLKLDVLPEDLLLSAGQFNVVNDRVAKVDIVKAAEVHPKLLLEGLIILDEDGHRLAGRIAKVELPKLTDDGILLADLIATTIVYRVEFPLSKPPARLSFQHNLNTASNVTAAVVHLAVAREGLTHWTMMQVPEGENAETVTFDWTQAGSAAAAFTGAPVMNLPAVEVTGTFLYIGNDEVRIEILIPLSMVESWVPVARANREVFELSEQAEARTALDKFFIEQNEMKIDGVLVKPELDRLSFYGIENMDFSVRPQNKRLLAATTRVGAILTYSTKGAPHEVDLKWTLFSNKEPAVRAVVFAYDKGSRILFSPDKPTFVWNNPGVPPLPKVEAIPTKQNAADDAARAALAETLLRNVYRGFDYRSESDVYDALARSVQGDLLTDLYLKIKQGLIMQEQGGAVARVKEVKVTKAEPVPGKTKDGFAERVTWQVEGTVEHWGHIHTRVNEYTADLSIVPTRGAWKINSMDVVKQSQVRSAVSLRKL